MPHFATERHAAHPADDMFALVADVERYPEFVPLCERLIVRKREGEPGQETLVADMTIGYKALRETFTTRVVLDRPNLAIQAQYLEGPFRHLDSRWMFVPESPRECLVRFSVDYEFRSRLLSVVMGTAFETMFGRMAKAFEARADALYGARAGA